MRITGMRLFLLALPVVLTALFLLTACGGKGGGGY
jgi:predicted small lipoprotein YifL